VREKAEANNEAMGKRRENWELQNKVGELESEKGRLNQLINERKANETRLMKDLD